MHEGLLDEFKCLKFGEFCSRCLFAERPCDGKGHTCLFIIHKFSFPLSSPSRARTRRRWRGNSLGGAFSPGRRSRTRWSWANFLDPLRGRQLDALRSDGGKAGRCECPYQEWLGGSFALPDLRTPQRGVPTEMTARQELPVAECRTPNNEHRTTNTEQRTLNNEH